MANDISLNYSDLLEMLAESQEVPKQQETSPEMRSSYRAEGHEVSWELYNPFGRWSSRAIDVREGLNLSVVEWDLQQDFSLTIDEQMQPMFGFSFCVGGDFLTKIAGSDAELNADPSEGHVGFFQGDVKTTSQAAAGEQVTLVQLGVDPCLLEALTDTPPDHALHPLNGIFSSTQEGFQWRAQKVTPAMAIALHQILQCPYQGLTRRVYLESKTLELIALQLNQLNEDQSSLQSSPTLKPEDMARIYLARDILIENLGDPPSLLALAKQAGINSFKLKQGFRQVFKTTVFGYLHAHRMEEARRLLELGQFNVTQISQAVGYAHSGKFAAAFKKKFGITPKTLRSR
ncbi:MAG: AraC family transcriptional regulator [Cyanobacteria bacterium P01_C01_bin.89]